MGYSLISYRFSSDSGAPDDDDVQTATINATSGNVVVGTGSYPQDAVQLLEDLLDEVPLVDADGVSASEYDVQGVEVSIVRDPAGALVGFVLKGQAVGSPWSADKLYGFIGPFI